MTSRVPTPAGDAAFRRDVAHDLSTPLGGLLLKIELADHYLRLGRIEPARKEVAELLRDVEAFGREFHAAFAAIADVAEGGEGQGDPRPCLDAAMDDLGDDAPRLEWQGESHRVTLPTAALTALMRRLVRMAIASGVTESRVVAEREGDTLRLTLPGVFARSGTAPRSVDGSLRLHLAVARELAARFGGWLDEAGDAPLRLVLPLARATG
ncbi:hypothetical protein [Luteibacter sp. 3190]|uniref:hypothetical protein n=1 Tax=Luteibacter sp. 3190 TaxID=2817736 RepID=UPI0028581085|nr:hypothetical protein [Luteibacter sp. 3190]MDR6935601.1 hypothetical protein [Luteibacter sp. 3190]